MASARVETFSFLFAFSKCSCAVDGEIPSFVGDIAIRGAAHNESQRVDFALGQPDREIAIHTSEPGSRSRS
jgi:hypothetical protein